MTSVRPIILLAAVCLSDFAQSFPLQLEMRVPFEPTAFPSGGQSYLLYELHLTNFQTTPLTVSRIDVLDADAPSHPVATFESDRLAAMLQPLGGKKISDPKEKLTIGDGQTTIVYLSVSFDRDVRVPERLIHRVTAGEASLEGAIIRAHHTALHVLGPPLEGAGWLASDGPGNDPDNHHRRGVVILDGRAVDSRRYAIDWKLLRNGEAYSGDAKNVHSYFCYGRRVLAVAGGVVVVARDGLPDNIPGHGDAFHPAVPITLETIAGNYIVLDLGGGQYAYYLHLQLGSLHVNAGDRVRRGQVLAVIGASGDAHEPHLHFEVTTSAKPLAGEGVPYVIDRYRSNSEDRTRELPLDKSVVEFADKRER